ncbi:hypothetical protein DFH06DRAFT_1314430 [Mycena polygramma]|nr:hypothetical protein DFH06DRAFT_1314430 [Mycena polygramma]
MSRPQKSAGPRTRPQKRAGRPERRAVTCTDCKTRIEASALRVASVVPTVDRAIMEIIRERVQSRADIDWTIDADTNVPYCQYEGPACCPPYLIHLAASRAGFSTEVAYLAYLDRSLPKDSNRPPQVILDDDDDPDGSADSIAHARAESPAEQLGGGSSNAPEEICNPDLAEHQAKVMDLQSARGRLVMNRFLHEDPAAKIMLQGVVAALETTVQSEKTKRHQKKELLIELRKRYQDKEAQIQQLNQTIAEIEEGRSRKYPGPVELAHSEICQDQPMPLAAEHPTHPLLVAAGRSASSHSVSWPIDHPLCDLSVLTADELLKLRRSLKSAKAPGYDAPVDLFARWLQVQKQGRIKGVPACGPDWIVDLRDVRGRNTIMPRVPPGPPMTRTTEERAHHRLCLFAVLRVLVIPGKYANIMRRSGISVACEVHFRCIFEKSYARPPTDEDVVRLLASQGLSMELADDSYQFCMNILQAYHGENPDAFGPGVSGVLLELAGKELDISGLPRGLHSQSQDLLPSFHGFLSRSRRQSKTSYLDSEPNTCRVSASAYCAPLGLLLVIIFDFISRTVRVEDCLNSLDSNLGGCGVSASAYCAPLELLLVIIFDFISRVSRPDTFGEARGPPARPPRQTSRAEDCSSSTNSDLGRYRPSASACCDPLELLLVIILDLIPRVSRLRLGSTTTRTPSASDIPRGRPLELYQLRSRPYPATCLKLPRL